MAYIVYVVVKLLAYIAWCWVGLRIWRAESASLVRASAWGVIRLAIGVGFGVMIFLAAATENQDLLWKYVAIYSPVRMLEWLILAFMIARTSRVRTARNVVLWCVGGIVVSFAADFASPEGIAGHFCVGRCLC
jgi:hypothetical protein